jgi:thiol-disulfide isomerase/thioredoxin
MKSYCIVLIVLCQLIFLRTERSDISILNEEIEFLDSTNQFSTIEDVLKLPRFQNKVVYIDLWGTTCIPCIKDFAFSEKLHKQFENQPVDFLYICYNTNGNIDDNQRKIWKKMATDHQLKGLHIYSYVLPPNLLIHQKIGVDFYKTHAKQIIAYAIPMYAIAKNGKIVSFYAKSPSDGNALYHQIDSILLKKL